MPERPGKPKPARKGKPGSNRPGIDTIRDPAMEQEILDRLSMGEPLAEICRSDDKFPHPSTWRNWCRADNDLAIAYDSARADGEDAIAADILRIADNPEIGYTVTSKPLTQKTDGVEEVIGEIEETRREDMLGHRRLKIDTRFKLLAKWNPKRWGDKTIIGGDEENPLQVKGDAPSTKEIARDIAFMLAKAQKDAADDPQS